MAIDNFDHLNSIKELEHGNAEFKSQIAYYEDGAQSWTRERNGEWVDVTENMKSHYRGLIESNEKQIEHMRSEL